MARAECKALARVYDASVANNVHSRNEYTPHFVRCGTWLSRAGAS